MAITKREFAQLLGLDAHHISRLVASGMPTRYDDKIDPVPALAWVLANVRPRGGVVHLAAMRVACGLVDGAE